MLEGYYSLILSWGLVATINVIAYFNSRADDFDSREELGSSPQEILKQISLSSKQVYNIEVSTDISELETVISHNHVSMSPGFAYSQERRDIIKIAELVYPRLNSHTKIVGLGITIIRAIKLSIVLFSISTFATSFSLGQVGWITAFTICLGVLSLCESMLWAAKLIRIKQQFFIDHEYYPYSTSSLMSQAFWRGFNQLWWLPGVVRFLGLKI